MQKVILYIFWAISLAIAGVFAWKWQNTSPTPIPIETTQPPIVEHSQNFGPIQPIPLSIKLDQDKVILGHRLFHDKRLSKDNTISCASCHDLNKGGTDQRTVSMGVDGEVGDINSPTVFNCGFNFKQFWDGRAQDLEEQAEGPIHNPKEMNSNWKEVISKLNQDPKYVQDFDRIYTNPINEKSIKDAIATFERSLITPNSRFDQFLRGNQEAITAFEKKGFQNFQDLGCIVCHQGVNLGSNTFQTMGKMQNYFKDKVVKPRDLGRFNVTKNERDKFKFKVPTLRNIELTAPYFHDGSAKTLEDAVNIMAEYQLGYELTEEETGSIVAFLKTLTGEYKKID